MLVLLCTSFFVVTDLTLIPLTWAWSIDVKDQLTVYSWMSVIFLAVEMMLKFVTKRWW